MHVNIQWNTHDTLNVPFKRPHARAAHRIVAGPTDKVLHHDMQARSLALLLAVGCGLLFCDSVVVAIMVRSSADARVSGWPLGEHGVL